MCMSSPKGDPTYIKNIERYFIEVAKTIALASTHPKAPGGCVIVRDRSIIGEGRSLLTHTKVEIDPVAHAIAIASKRGAPSVGCDIYSTRYPFSASVFQAHCMGVRQIFVLAHDWEPYYKDEFNRAGRLARELCIPIEPIFEDEDPRFQVNSYENKTTVTDSELYSEEKPYSPDEYDIQIAEDIDNENSTSF